MLLLDATALLSTRMLAGEPRVGGLGVRLCLAEQLVFPTFGPAHMLTLHLAIVGTSGSPR